jgi:hypothetical protein
MNKRNSYREQGCLEMIGNLAKTWFVHVNVHINSGTCISRFSIAVSISHAWFQNIWNFQVVGNEIWNW